MSKTHISLAKRCAAALLTMRTLDENGELVPLIPDEHARQMTAEQIISLFHFDHCPIPEFLDGPTEPWNLKPKMIAEHRIKTAKKDIPTYAKVVRLSAAQEEFRKSLLAKAEGQPKPARKKSSLAKRNGTHFDWKQGKYVRDE